MEEIGVAAAAAAQPVWPADQPLEPSEAAGGMQSALDQMDEDSKTLAEMIKEAQERTDAHREALKRMPKGNAHYVDAPLEAYARLARAKTASQVDAASGFARRRIPASRPPSASCKRR